MKPAERSSTCTCTWMLGSRARASEIGVDRDPGAIDRVGDAGPGPLVDERGAEGRLPRSPRPRPGALRSAPMSSPPLVLAHGFTQNKPLLGAVPRPAGRPAGAEARRPGRARRRAAGPGPARGGVPARDGTAAGAPTSATRWAAGSPSTWRSPSPSWSTALVLIGAHPGLEDRGRAGRPGRGRRRAGRPPGRGRVAHVPRRVAGPAAVRLAAAGGRPAGGAPDQRPRRPGHDPAQPQHRSPDAALGPPPRARDARALRGRRGRRPVRPPRPAGGRHHRGQRPPRDRPRGGPRRPPRATRLRGPAGPRLPGRAPSG